MPTLRRAIAILSVIGLAGCFPTTRENLDAAQARCVSYGFSGQDALARCVGSEVNNPPAEPIGSDLISAAHNQCLSLGYAGDTLAQCTQRNVRTAAP